MKCVICQHGYTEKSFTTVTLERNQSVLVFKQVPADICDNCGEVYWDLKILIVCLPYLMKAKQQMTPALQR